MIDNFSKFINLVIILGIEADTIIDAFRCEWLLRYPHPSIITTYQGTQFMNNNFKSLLNRYSITH
ncbi:hypothetical protein HERIO_1820 [Hepatospora eriocheir]|uniref:Integrase catalytic domain-containing protein n=1 Tax=Hepatospora eriocheir TaxID=1081669 RepID=A0A1X0Q8V5_9MICR|nr:hypothetical protein HERIO_1820 [Hepatospora eriocheir]